jgi:uncharacterized alpha-E superfamily protein
VSLLSRVADSAYWMSRYLERAEQAARLGEIAGVDDGNCETIAACVTAARENARQVREHVSSEMWEQINRLYLRVRRQRDERDGLGLGAFFRAVTEASALFQGVTDSTMSNGEGWHFIQIGRFIERAATTSTMLDVHFADHPETDDEPFGIGAYVEWVALLRSCAAFETYCRRYTADIRPDRVAEFLLLNADCPRSVRFAIDRVEVSLRAIALEVGKSVPGRLDRLAGRLRASLDYSQIDEILADSLRSYVVGIRQQCEQVHTALYQSYISYPIEAAITS